MRVLFEFINVARTVFVHFVMLSYIINDDGILHNYLHDTLSRTIKIVILAINYYNIWLILIKYC